MNTALWDDIAKSNVQRAIEDLRVLAKVIQMLAAPESKGPCVVKLPWR